MSLKDTQVKALGWSAFRGLLRAIWGYEGMLETRVAPAVAGHVSVKVLRSTTARSVAEIWLDRTELDKIRIVIGIAFGS